MNFFILTVLFVASALAQHEPNYCYVTDPVRSQSNRWSSRVNNDIIRGRGQVNPNVSSCTPAKFWFYTRHADRLPGVNDIGRMQSITPVSTVKPSTKP